MRKLRFLIINTDYEEFITQHYQKNPDLTKKSFQEQYRARMDTLFGTADFFSTELNKLGHDAWDIIYNHPYLQKQWAMENTPSSYLDALSSLKGNSLSNRFTRAVFKKTVEKMWFDRVLEAQIKYFEPTVIYNMAMESINYDFLRTVKKRNPSIKLIVGQHAAPLTPSMENLSCYDLILSSLPNLVDHFKRKGVKSAYLKLAFGGDPILAKLKKSRKKENQNDQHEQNDIVFIGSIGAAHLERLTFIEKILEAVPSFKLWGVVSKDIPPHSPIRARHQGGPLFGLEMYNEIANAKIVFNRHLDIAEGYANNMRLYEATGCGSLLLTDYKKNIHDLFEPSEVVTYSDVQDSIQKIQYLLKNNALREKIARAGQKRVLKEHLWSHRMKEFIGLITKEVHHAT